MSNELKKLEEQQKDQFNQLCVLEGALFPEGGVKEFHQFFKDEFGSHGARYTDIIKFAYYLGSPNAPKYSNANRGYYSCAFAMRYGGHLITGGKDQLVKGINKENDERYFALSFVESATDYWKYLDEVKRRKS